MRVVCIKGVPDLLQEGMIYTVVRVTKKGNYILDEVKPPIPFTSFYPERFIEISEFTDIYSDTEVLELEEYGDAWN